MSALPNLPSVLVVDDSVEDWSILKRAFSKSNYQKRLSHIDDAQKALELLRTGNEAPLPSIILLDLNMPGMDGREFLAHIKSDPSLKSIPVVILSTSGDERDVRYCYEKGASTYIVKPTDMKTFSAVVDAFENYWFGAGSFPSNFPGVII